MESSFSSATTAGVAGRLNPDDPSDGIKTPVLLEPQSPAVSPLPCRIARRSLARSRSNTANTVRSNGTPAGSVLNTPTGPRIHSTTVPSPQLPGFLTSFDEWTTPPQVSDPRSSPLSDSTPRRLRTANVATGLSTLYARVRSIAFSGRDSEPEPDAAGDGGSSAAATGTTITTTTLTSTSTPTATTTPADRELVPSPMLAEPDKKMTGRDGKTADGSERALVRSTSPDRPAGREGAKVNASQTPPTKTDGQTGRPASVELAAARDASQTSQASQQPHDGPGRDDPASFLAQTAAPKTAATSTTASSPSSIQDFPPFPSVLPALTGPSSSMLFPLPPLASIREGKPPPPDRPPNPAGEGDTGGPVKTAKDSIMAFLSSGRRWGLNRPFQPESSKTAQTDDAAATKQILDKRFWIKNDAAQYCFKCGRQFGTFNRKHHCRTCGHIFDAACTTSVPGEWLGLGSNSHQVRVCLPCEQIVIARVESDDDMIEDEEYTNAYIDMPGGSDGSFGVRASGRPPMMNIPVSVSVKGGGVRPVLEIDPTLTYTNTANSAASSGVAVRPSSSRRSRHVPTSWETSVTVRTKDLDEETDCPSRAESTDQSPSHHVYERRRHRASFCGARPNANLLKALGVESPRPTSRSGSRLARQSIASISALQSHRTIQELGPASLRHVRCLLKQLLSDGRVKQPSVWLRHLMPMVLRCVDQVDPNLQRDDNMDIRNYIKLKRVPGGDITDSRVVSGIVFTKNVAIKNMSHTVQKPRIAIVTFPLEYAHTHEGVIPLETLISQEREHVKNLVDRIVALGVNVLFAMQNVSNLAMRFLSEAGIVVVQHVKMSVLHAISRCTNVEMATSVDKLTHGDSMIGTCGRFDVKTYLIRRDGSARKTVVVLSGCQPDLGATLMLRGADKGELGKIKRLVEFMCYVVYNLHLERSLLVDEGVANIEEVKGGGGVVAYPGFTDSETDAKAAYQTDGPAGLDSDQDKSGEFYARMVRRLRSRVLSSSPRVAVTEPYALAKARAEECRLESLRAQRDRYAVLRNSTADGADENGETDDKTSSNQPFALVVPSMVRDGVDEPSPPVRDFLHALHAGEYEQALLTHEYQKQQWLAYRHDDLFDPVQHQQLAVLLSCVNEGTGVPCEGPELSRFVYYNDDDQSEESSTANQLPSDKERLRQDVTLGQYVRNLVLTAYKPCPSDCGSNGYRHRWQYVHGNGQITVRVQRIANPVGGALEGRVSMWSSCRICERETKKRPMSEGTWKYSFAKYLEMTYLGVPLRLASTEFADSSSDLDEPEQTNTVCTHDAHRDFVRYIALGHAIVTIQYDTIEMWQIVLPAGVIRWNVDADLLLKNSQFEKIDGMIGLFVASVRKRLNAMEQAVKVMMPGKDKDKLDKPDKKDDRVDEKKDDKAQPDEKADGDRPEPKEATAHDQKAPVSPGVATADSSVAADSLPADDPALKPDGADKDKIDDGPETLSAMEQCQVELVGQRLRADSDFHRLRRLLRQIYVESKHYEVLPFDKALVELNSCACAWQDIFARMEQVYFPSEGVIDQLANAIMAATDPGSDSVSDPAPTDGDGEQESEAGIDRPAGQSELSGSQATEKTTGPTEDAIASRDEPALSSDRASVPSEKKSSDDGTTRSGTGVKPSSPPSPPRSRIPRAKEKLKSGVQTSTGPASPSSSPTLTHNGSSRRISGRNVGMGQAQPSYLPRPGTSAYMTTALQRIQSQTASRIPIMGQAGSLGPPFLAGNSAFGNPNSHVQHIILQLERNSRREQEARQRQQRVQSHGPGLGLQSRVSSLVRSGKHSRTGSERTDGADKKVRMVDQVDVTTASSDTTSEEVKSVDALGGARKHDGEQETAEPSLPVPVSTLDGTVKPDGADISVGQDESHSVEGRDQPAKEDADADADHGGDKDRLDDRLDKDKDDDRPDKDKDDKTKPDAKYHRSDTSTPDGDSAEADPAFSRNVLIKLLVNMWPRKPAPGWPALEMPLSSYDHIFDNFSSFVLREDEPVSVAALALSLPEYQASLSAAIAAGDPWTVAADAGEPDDKGRFSYSFSHPHKQIRASCKVLYAPQFDALRRKAGVADRFVDSLSRCRKWDSKGGKTRSLFLKTLDDRFVVKSLSVIEANAFNRFANEYFLFMQHTLCHGLASALAKMLGLFQVTIRNPATGLDFSALMLVMENLFYNRQPDRRYDLKGSMRNRRIESTGEEDEVLLDENLVERIYQQPVFAREHDTRAFGMSIGNDSLFLSRMNVMDYSLIAGFEDKKCEIIVGIIDCIRTYTWDKKLESWIKDRSSKNQPTIVSPDVYRNRFRGAMAAYILQSPAYWYHFYVNGAVLKEKLEEGRVVDVTEASA